jgi:DNA-binding winged helix-turn-helix (wHTH) protein
MVTPPVLLFSPFRIDLKNEQLWRDGKEVVLRRKTFAVLRHLVEHPGQLITKTALLDAVWGAVAISDSLPAVCVAELRKALGDEAKTPRLIETRHRRGYRFVAKVVPAEAPRSLANPNLPSPDTAAIVVGRERELASLRGWYSQASEGARRIVFVAGEPGIGKTTLVRFFSDSLRNADVRIGRGQCVEQYGAGEPYMPMLEALTRLCREPDGDQLIDILRRLAPAWLAQMPTLLNAAERREVLGQVEAATQQRMLREIAEALEAIAAETPLVLVLEDLHWSDPSTLDLIAAIGRRSEHARLLLLGTYRPVEMLTGQQQLSTLKEELELHRQCIEMRLRLLGEADIASYLVRRFADGESHQALERVAPLIYARTDGNPLFMVNVVDYLVERGSLLDVHKVEPPPNIRQMIERNLQRLAPDEQQVLEVASVVGVEFSAAAVAAGLAQPVSQIESCCRALARREQFVDAYGASDWPDGTVSSKNRFHHALYREVLYDRVTPSRRLELHQRIADRIERAYGTQADEVAAELADHYLRAHERRKAIHYFHRAGKRAADRSASAEATSHIKSGLDLLATLPDTVERAQQELEFQLLLGAVLIASKGWSAVETEAVYRRAAELCQRVGHTSQTFPVLYGVCAVQAVRPNLKETRKLGQEFLSLAIRDHDPAAIIEGHFLTGYSLFFLGDLSPALAATVFRNRAPRGINGGGGERKGSGVPVSIAVQHGVENDEEFAHAGGERRLRVFPACPQLSVKVLDDRIGTHGGDHGHVQNAPDLSAATPDTTTAAQFSTVAVKGRQAGQRSDLFAIKLAQFGQVREQGSREHRTDSRHRAEQLVALAPDRGRTDQGGEFVIESGQPLFQPTNVFIDAFVDHLGRVSPAILFRREHLN